MNVRSLILVLCLFFGGHFSRLNGSFSTGPMKLAGRSAAVITALSLGIPAFFKKQKQDEQGAVCLVTVDPKVPNGKKLF